MKLKLLWADDQPDVIESFVGFLPSTYAITLCSNGTDALARLKAEGFDLLVLDLFMPPEQWGGLWLLDQLKRSDIKIPVIVVSGEGSQVETIKALRLGANDYVLKTHITSELSEQVQNVLSSIVAAEISSGESATVEFKATARWDTRLKVVGRPIEHSAMKTVAGFLNSVEGGRLYIGVGDGGEIFGIASDLATLGRRQDLDAYENWLTTAIITRMGYEVIPFLKIRFHKIQSQILGEITVKPATGPVFLKGEGKEQFFARAGNSTRELVGREVLEYCNNRWPQ